MKFNSRATAYIRIYILCNAEKYKKDGEKKQPAFSAKKSNLKKLGY